MYFCTVNSKTQRHGHCRQSKRLMVYRGDIENNVWLLLESDKRGTICYPAGCKTEINHESSRWSKRKDRMWGSDIWAEKAALSTMFFLSWLKVMRKSGGLSGNTSRSFPGKCLWKTLSATSPNLSTAGMPVHSLAENKNGPIQEIITGWMSLMVLRMKWGEVSMTSQDRSLP